MKNSPNEFCNVNLLEHLLNAVAIHEVVCDDGGRILDYRYIYVNRAFEDLIGKSRQSVLGKRVTEIFPTIIYDRFNWIEYYGLVGLRHVGAAQFKQHFATLDRTYHVKVYSPQIGYFTCIFEEVSPISKMNIQADLEKSRSSISVFESYQTMIKTFDSPEEIYQHTMRYLEKISNLVSVVTVRDYNGKLLPEMTSGICPELKQDWILESHYPFCVVKKGTELDEVFGYPTLEEYKLPPSWQHNGLSSMIFIPLRIECMNIAGVMFFSSQENAFSSYLLDVMGFLLKEMTSLINKEKKIKDIEDTCEQLRLQVLQNNKLSLLGQMTGEMIHEINNPLTIIAGNVEMLERRLAGAGEADPFIKRSVNYQMEAVKRILELVSVVKQVTKKDSKQFDVVNVVEELAKSFALAKALYTKHGVELEFQTGRPEYYIKGNKGLLHQIFLNILSNAKDAVMSIKTKRKISVKIFEQGKQVVIIFQDNGVGIHPSKLGEITTKFYTTKESGTGIGLSVVSEIVSSLQGRLDINSILGNGTTVTIELPEVLGHQEDATENIEKEIVVRGHALIVDDEPEVRMTLGLMLERLGLLVSYAAHGEEALLKIREQEFQYLFVDLMMPVMDGRTLVDRLKGSPYFQGKTIVVTGIIEKAVFTGDVDVILHKPVLHNDLVRLFQSFLVK